jgi:cytochrome c
MYAMHRRHLLILSVCLATSAFAADPAHGTRDEAKALAMAAAAHVNAVGSAQAFKDFASDPKWRPKDMYPFSLDMNGVMLYHGANEKLVGKNFAEVRDSSGKEFNKEMIAIAKKGGGWVDYQWAHPVTKKVEDKTSYIVKIDKPEGLVGVGIYR